MADLHLHVCDYEWITRHLTAIADEYCGSRLVSVLEGGYDPRALAACVAAHVHGL